MGYLVTEGIVDAFEHVKEVRYNSVEEVFYIQVTQFNKHTNFSPELQTSGIATVRQQDRMFPFKIESRVKISPKVIFQSQEDLIRQGKLWKTTGGAHMAALCSNTGEILFIAEDVGRHNTIDKIIGEAYLHGIDISQCFAIISGRLSVAMVSKMAQARLPILVSKAAPIDKGIDLARQIGMTLIGFARDPEMNIYSYPERIELDMFTCADR